MTNTIEDHVDSGQEWPFAEFGSSGLNRWGGSVQEEFLVELQGLRGRRLYQEMRWNDPVINAVFFGIEHSIRQVRFFAEPASSRPQDIENAKFLEQAINDMSFSWDDTLLNILYMLEQGVSILEIVYKKRLGQNPPQYVRNPAISTHSDGKIGWRKWASRPVETLTVGKEWIYDDHGGVIGISQTAPPDYQETTIPIEKLLMFRTTPAPHNNPEGRPILRSMFSSYWYASQLREVEAIGVERDLIGMPIAYMGRDTTIHGDRSDYDLLKKGLRNIRRDEQEAIVIPRHKMKEGENTGIRIELLSPERSTARMNVGDIISRYEKRMAMSVLAQFVMLGMDNVGSFALWRGGKDFFSMAIGAWARQITEVINRFAVPRLFQLNPSLRLDDLPKWSHSEAGVPDLEALATYVNKMVQAQVITPDDTLEKSIRAFARLPQRQEEQRNLDIEDTEAAAAQTDQELDILMETVDEMLREGEDPNSLADLVTSAMFDEVGVNGNIR